MRTTATALGRIFEGRIAQAALVMTASVFLPLFIHRIPAAGVLPAGARWLAMFYAPFISLFFFPLWVSVSCAAGTAYLNFLLTGMPAKDSIAFLSVEIVLFTLIAYIVRTKMKRFPGIATFAYLVTQVVLACAGFLHTAFFAKIMTGFPGLVAMFCINGYVLLLCGDKDPLDNT